MTAARAALSVVHLGLLEHRTRLATADILTMMRGNFPAMPGGAGRASGALAVGLDLADGRLARHQGATTPFGEYASTFADAAYWTWLTLRHEPSRTLRTAAIAAWALPVVTVTGLALRRGTMPERPRPVLLRPAAALQGRRRPEAPHPPLTAVGCSPPSSGASGSGVPSTRTPCQNATWPLIFRARGLGLG